MLTLDDLAKRKTEIVAARASFVAKVEAAKARIANIDGALELLAILEKDLEANAQAAAASDGADACVADQSWPDLAGDSPV